jgi:hypothetical protein
MRGLSRLSRVTKRRERVAVAVARMGVGGGGEQGRGAPEYTAGRAGHGRQMMQIHASGAEWVECAEWSGTQQ